MDILAVDPGQTCGVALLGDGPPLCFSCNSLAVVPLVMWLIECCHGPENVVLAGEEFRSGRGAGARQAGAADTRKLIAKLDELGSWHWRPAVTIKAWSTDRRLKAAGLFDVTAKMVDARDAARHALYSACYDTGRPDPLSKAGRVIENAKLASWGPDTKSLYGRPE